MRRTSSFIMLVCLFVPWTNAAAGQGVRVVDAVNVSAAGDEVSHGLTGEEMTTGEAAGRRWRSSTRSFSYSLRIYEDTPLTIVCTFAAGASREAFDILVEGRKEAGEVRELRTPRGGEVRFTLPLAATAGRTAVLVTFQARAGSQTARLLEVKSVQEHLE